MLKKFKSLKANKKGFTLAELLIVVAIIAILAAIAIPVFAAQLENAKEAVDRANARAAQSMAVADYSLNHANEEKAVTYAFVEDDAGNFAISTYTIAGGSATALPSAPVTGDPISPNSKGLKDIELTVTVTDGKVTANTWLTKLNS